MGEVRIRYGIQLYERTCKTCKAATFWVPKRSPQIFCGEQCELDFTGKSRRFFKIYAKRRKPKTMEELLDDEFD